MGAHSTFICVHMYVLIDIFMEKLEKKAVHIDMYIVHVYNEALWCKRLSKLQLNNQLVYFC